MDHLADCIHYNDPYYHEKLNINMEISLVKNVVTVTQKTDVFDLDIKQLYNKVIENYTLSDANLSEDDKDNIILEFDINFNMYLENVLGISIEDLPYADSEGYDLGVNAEMIEEIKNTFADYVYNK